MAGANRNCWIPDTFSLVDYQEADRVLADWKATHRRSGGNLSETAGRTSATLSLNWCFTRPRPANRSTTFTSRRQKTVLYASQGRASANDYAAQARALFQADADLSAYYNHALAGRQMGSHDGPDAYRLHVLATAAHERHARRWRKLKFRRTRKWEWPWKVRPTSGRARRTNPSCRSSTNSPGRAIH